MVKDFEVRLKRKDGTVFWGSITSIEQTTAAGITQIVNVFEDITENKGREEEILRQSKVLDGINKVFREALTCETDEEVANKCLSVAEELTGSEFGFIGEVNPAGRFDNIAISNPGWDACKMPDSEATLSTKDMEIRGIDRSVLREGKSRIVNDPASYPDRVGLPEGHPPITSFLGVPLKSLDKTIGMIGLGNKESGYDLADQEAIEDISVAFMEALHRKRAEIELRETTSALREKTDRLTKLYGLGITMGKSCEEIADHIVTIITSTTRMKMASVEKIENDTISIASFFKDGRISHKGTLSLKDSPCAEVVKDKKPCEQHRAAEKFPQNVFLRENNVYSCSCVPVISSKGDVIGIICGMDSVEIDFSEEDKELLYTLGRRMASEWEQESYISQIRNANRRLETLLKVASSLSQSLELEEILNQALNAMFESDFLKLEEEALVFILDKEKQELVLTTHHGLSEDVIQYEARVNVGECLCGKAALTGEVLFSPNSEKNPQHTRCMPHIGIHADIVIPLKSREEILGILMCHRKVDTAFSTEERDIFGSIGSQFGMAIENAILFKKTQNYTVKLEEGVKQRTQEINIINEELVRASQAKSDFLANMSHELRTPLTAVIGFSEVLKDQYFGELNEKQAGYVKDIFESGKHLLSLINDILDLSKVEAGKMELELSGINIKHLLENSMIMIKEKAMKHGIRLDLQIPDELSDLEIQADERKIKQVLFNLLSNAAKFTPDGGAIEVEAKQVAEELIISVSDTGIGIAPEDQKKIFEEFYQVIGGRKDKTPGTGLGLPLSMRLLEIHGGRLWVESKGKNKGSRFYFTLPYKSRASKTIYA